MDERNVNAAQLEDNQGLVCGTAKSCTTPVDKDDIRVAYSVATQASVGENSIFWSRFAAMLGIHAGLLVAMGFLIENASNSAIRLLGLAVLNATGVGLGFAWVSMSKRAALWTEYWNRRALELEELLDPRIATYSKITLLPEATGVQLAKGTIKDTAIKVVYALVALHGILAGASIGYLIFGLGR